MSWQSPTLKNRTESAQLTHSRRGKKRRNQAAFKKWLHSAPLHRIQGYRVGKRTKHPRSDHSPEPSLDLPRGLIQMVIKKTKCPGLGLVPSVPYAWWPVARVHPGAWAAPSPYLFPVAIESSRAPRCDVSTKLHFGIYY